jgi:hypothetical protein
LTDGRSENALALANEATSPAHGLSPHALCRAFSANGSDLNAAEILGWHDFLCTLHGCHLEHVYRPYPTVARRQFAFFLWLVVL